jgi:putative transposase
MVKLVRYQQCGCFHFVTFSCYRRQPLSGTATAYGVFERELEAVRVRYGFVVAGYVLMPEHVHLLVGEPRRSSLSIALQVLKQQTSRKLKQRGEVQFWQRRYYDFNVWSEEKRVEKLRYMHRNPVKRGLVEKPEQWQWSSFRHYANGQLGVVEIESQWTAFRRGNQLPEHLRYAEKGGSDSCPPTLRQKRGEGWGTHRSLSIGRKGAFSALNCAHPCAHQSAIARVGHPVLVQQQAVRDLGP